MVSSWWKVHPLLYFEQAVKPHLTVELFQQIISSQRTPVTMNSQVTKFLKLIVTISLVDNLHFPQNKTVMTVGHFLVQFLCPASKIRTKVGGKTDLTKDDLHATGYSKSNKYVLPAQNWTMLDSLIMSYCGELSLTVYWGWLTLGLS